jgi:hypothetical protein
MPPPALSTSPGLTCATLAQLVQAPLRRRLGLVIGLGLALLTLLFVLEFPHADALALIALGAAVPLILWVRQLRPGLPILVLVALQTLAIFGLPILTRNPSLENYLPGDVLAAAQEVLFFGLALGLGWSLAQARLGPASPPRFWWSLKFISAGRPETLQRAALALLGAAALYLLLLQQGLLEPVFRTLPQGAFSLARTLCDAAVVAGGLIGGFVVGSRAMPTRARVAFWALVGVVFLVNSSGILLSANSAPLAAVLLGLFLGARRPPWIFLGVVVAALSLLNLGKFEMRAVHWDEHGQARRVPMEHYPAFYGEWIERGLRLAETPSTASDLPAGGQRLTDRLDNLQNLLFAQVAIEHRGIELLGGATYTLIPPLLIPRLLWPEKPRTHEGQILLNVHFGRQSLEDTFTTYIAWGLLAEAYANFGPLFGALFCGLVLGLLVGALERWAKPYPITSLQTFFLLIITVNLLLSFEMVASVWVTSLFQLLTALLLGVAPLSERRRLEPSDGPAP